MNQNFDFTKLVKLCEEINFNWRYGNYISVIALLRTILHHFPTLFGFRSFEGFVNNYNGGQSFKKVMLHLLQSSKNIADQHLHSQACRKEILPNITQVDYKNDIDLLLTEILKRFRN